MSYFLTQDEIDRFLHGDSMRGGENGRVKIKMTHDEIFESHTKEALNSFDKWLKETYKVSIEGVLTKTMVENLLEILTGYIREAFACGLEVGKSNLSLEDVFKRLNR